MNLFDLLEEFSFSAYSNEVVVFIAFFLLVFVITFSILTKIDLFQKNKAVNVIISFVISVYSVYYLKEQYYWIIGFNSLLVLTVILLLLFFLKPFVRFFRGQF